MTSKNWDEGNTPSDPRYEESLTEDRLLEAADVLVSLQSAFTSLRMLDDEQDRQASAAGLQCVMVGMYAIELAKHLHDGMEFHDALRATVRGEMQLDTKLSKDLEKAIRDLKDPMRQN